jgi:predicted DNA-binding transcriptional regulator YafY
MRTRRLARLMSIINDIRYNPASDIDQLCARFLISRRQFYKDRDSLAALGYEFHFSRKRGRLVLDSQPRTEEHSLPPDELMALFLSIKDSLQKDNLYQALAAGSGAEKMAAALPPPLKRIFLPALKQVLWEDGLKISPEMFTEIMLCIQEQRRIVALFSDERPPLLLDPAGLVLQQGVLCLRTPSLPPDYPDGILLAGFTPPAGGLVLARVRKIVPTPFFSPRGFDVA